MNTLADFQQQITHRLAQDRVLLTAPSTEIHRLMLELQPRLQRFEEYAPRLIAELIQPRLQTLVANFVNADIENGTQRDRCAAWFGYCNRFPVSCKTEFTVDHDEHVEKLIVHFNLTITPVFFKYEPSDKLVLNLDQLDEAMLANWVERNLLAFLDDYLRLDHGDEFLDDEIVTDPVCGMRISRGMAAFREEYRGHSYYFCTEDCRNHFQQTPQRYIWFKT